MTRGIDDAAGGAKAVAHRPSRGRPGVLADRPRARRQPLPGTTSSPRLDRFETPADIDVPALRQQVLERSKSRSKNEPPPQKRTPIAPELTKLPTFNGDVQFDVDTPIVLPGSYETLGRIADALTHSSLLPYTFLVVGHVESTGGARTTCCSASGGRMRSATS